VEVRALCRPVKFFHADLDKPFLYGKLVVEDIPLVVWGLCFGKVGDLRLVYGCSAMETHFIKLPTNSSCADVASRDSLELDSECCNRGQMIFTCYALHYSVSLCGLPLRS
jgi:hypothetical protein